MNDDLLPKGAGDPDFYGYPGEGDVTPSTPRLVHKREYWTWPSKFDGSDNMPDDPEQQDKEEAVF